VRVLPVCGAGGLRTAKGRGVAGTLVTMTASPITPVSSSVAPASPAAPSTEPSRDADLLRAVDSALAAIRAGGGPLDVHRSVGLGRWLRDALTMHISRFGERRGPVPAVRVACAYLAAGDIEGAYHSLLTARERLA
jgi:hypothetical protein